MLARLRIKNFAIIEELEIEFALGFNVLSGETGAGKSILIDALVLALGGKARQEQIRSGADFCEVEAVFELENNDEIFQLLKELGIEKEQELILRRRVSAQGRSSAWVNLHSVPVSVLSRLRESLIDIYGQHEYQSLLRPEHHLSFLDAFGEIWERFSDYQALYQDWQELRKEYESLKLSEKERREKEDLLRFRIQELESANLRSGEEEELEAERARLRHSELLRRASEFAYQELYEREGAVLEKISAVIAELEKAGEYDPALKKYLDDLSQAQALVEEVGRELGEYLSSIEADPKRLEEIEERRAELKRLKRKYQMEIDELIEFLNQSKKELETLSNYESRIEEIEKELAEKKELLEKRSQQLSKERKIQAKKLEKKLEQVLKELGMKKCRFEVKFEELDEPELLGKDRVEFYLSTNPGEELKPLSKIASGGELSRIMLGLRNILALKSGAKVLIFDEVDTGIGGAIAEVVGKKLKQLSETNQVLCITHLAQIAKFADHHIYVWKEESKGRTVARVKPLSEKERIDELARMIGGIKITDKTRAYARELLEEARR